MFGFNMHLELHSNNIIHSQSYAIMKLINYYRHHVICQPPNIKIVADADYYNMVHEFMKKEGDIIKMHVC